MSGRGDQGSRRAGSGPGHGGSAAACPTRHLRACCLPCPTPPLPPPSLPNRRQDQKVPLPGEQRLRGHVHQHVQAAHAGLLHRAVWAAADHGPKLRGPGEEGIWEGGRVDNQQGFCEGPAAGRLVVGREWPACSPPPPTPNCPRTHTANPQSCEMRFGVPPPPIEEDKVYSQPCFTTQVRARLLSSLPAPSCCSCCAAAACHPLLLPGCL